MIPKTIISDIDGTILNHVGSLHNIYRTTQHVLPGVIEKFGEWKGKSYFIVLITARPESMRRFTELQLEKLGLYFDVLVMGASHGERIVLNDEKPGGDGYEQMPVTASGITIKRDKGLGEVNV